MSIVLRFFLSFLFPTPCVFCGILGQALCKRCREQLEFYPHRRELPGLSVISALYYETDGNLAALIHPLKYAHQADLVRFLIPPLREALKLLLDPSRVILVPVPLHPRRLLERGYNQVELLAHGIGHTLGVPVIPLLRRVRDTTHQTLTTHREERAHHLEGAFEMAGPLPENGQIVLVDDIVTTGSTLLACAQVLQAAGAQDLCALTLADRNEAPPPPWH